MTMQRLVRTSPAVRVTCALCGAGVERVEFAHDVKRGRKVVRIFCHGDGTEVELDPMGPAIRELVVFEPEPEEPKGERVFKLSEDQARLFVAAIAGTTMPVLKMDGVGGASSSGDCSCGARGCTIENRAEGCPGRSDR